MEINVCKKFLVKRKLLRNMTPLELQPEVDSVQNCMMEHIKSVTHKLPMGKFLKFWWEHDLKPDFRRMQAVYQKCFVFPNG